jgi:predicted transcriptional regulator
MEEGAIFSLWKSNERKRFGEIKRELNRKLPHTYDQKQVARYLHRLLVKGLLCKYDDDKGPYYVRADAPNVREYRLSSHFSKIRNHSLNKGWFVERDVGPISFVRVGFYGIPEVDRMTDLELNILGNIAFRLKETFMDYHCLSKGVANRLKKRWKRIVHSQYYYDLFYNYIFDLMVEKGKAALHRWDDIGIEELCSMVPDFLEFMNGMREKYGSIVGRHKVKEGALAKALELLEISEADSSAIQKSTMFDARSYNPDLIALVVTTSPKTVEDYASHPENVIKDYWTKTDGTECPADTIKEVLEKEKKGIDYFAEQESHGIPLGDICLGLEDLSRYFTLSPDPKGLNKIKIMLDDNVVARLRKWDWLIDRIGHEGLDEFIKLVRLRDKLGR